MLGSTLLVARDARAGRQVVLLRSTWEKHVLPNHPELSGLLEAMAACIETPGMILASDKHPNRELYYRRQTLRSGRYAWVKVVVVFRANGAGVVVTAFLTDTVRGGDILWMAPDFRI